MAYLLRAQQIIIDATRIEAEPWINIRVQRIELDKNNEQTQIIDRWGSINKKLSKVALEVVPYDDLLSPPQNTISIVGLSDAVKSAADSWIIEKYGGVLDDEKHIKVDK